MTFGKFRTIDLGDLLWNNEGDLMCPNNPIGTVDLYLVSHHGTDPSGSTALVHALAPRVAIMQNGTRKGGTVQTLQTLHTSPGLEDIWQLHWAYNGGIEHNPSGLFIANIDDPETIAQVITAPPGAGRGMGPGGPASVVQHSRRRRPARRRPTCRRSAAWRPGGGRGGHTGPAYLIKVSAQDDGTFTVTNTRNNFTKTYRR